jgi:3',5'-cyclic AMP phosphodiesterase CpdA
VIHTGDLSDNGSYEELRLAKMYLDELIIPYYITPGNRDCPRKLIEVFAEQLGDVPVGGPIIYLVDNFPIKLVSLDTTTPDDNLGLLNFTKVAALDKILLMNQNEPVIVFSHHPPFDFSLDGLPLIEFANEISINLFDEIVDRHSQIVALFCGHVHRPIRKSMRLFDANIAPPVCNLLNYNKAEIGDDYIGSFQLHEFGQGHNFTTEVKMISN